MALTPKRARLLAQVQNFCKDYGHDSVWVDTNNGKIMLKLKNAHRGTHIKDTSMLVDLDTTGSFNPAGDNWYFCSPPYFIDLNDLSLPLSPSALQAENHFSPHNRGEYGRPY